MKILLILSLIPITQKKKIKKIILANLILVFLEILSVSLILPFLIFLTNKKELLFQFQFLNNFSQTELVISSIIVLALIYTKKNIYSFFVLKYNAKFIYYTTRELSNFLFNSYLKKPYGYFSNINSSIAIRNVIQDVNTYSGSILFPLIIIISEILIFIILSSFLIIFNTLIFLSVFISVLFFLLIIYLLIKKKLKKWGDISHTFYAKKIFNTKQGIEGIKEIILNNSSNYFFSIFKNDNNILIRSDIKKTVYLNFPKLMLEIFMVYTFVVVIFILNLLQYSFEDILITLGFFTATAFRIMPSFLRISSNLNAIKFNLPTLDNLKKEIYLCEKSNSDISKNNFQFDYYKFNSLNFVNVEYKYKNIDSYIFKNLNFKFCKGDKIGIFGSSGAGKSTFLDLFTGLTQPNEGSIETDSGVSIFKNTRLWQSLIGYVPQKPYILDGTIKQNIIFNNEEDVVNDDIIYELLRILDLNDFVLSLPNKLNQHIAEQGNKLSGGQLQRIAIARALFRKPKILVLDEVTNALDLMTEEKILDNIFSNYSYESIILISHNKESLKRCNKIYSLSDKKLILESDNGK